MKGVFITLEGPDGSGKTTHIGFVCEQLRQAGFNVLQTRQPGGSQVAEAMRSVVLGVKFEEKIHPRAELLLFAASRAQTVEAVIKPALAEGMIVVSDRFHDSAWAYQGHARGFDREARLAEDIAHPDFFPDITLFFDISYEESHRRLSLRNKEYNRLNAEDEAFKRRCHDGFELILHDGEDRLIRIDGHRSIEAIQTSLANWVKNVFTPKHAHLQQIT